MLMKYVVNVSTTLGRGFKLLILPVLLVLVVVPASSEAQTDMEPFVTTWRINGPGEPITIPVGGTTGTYTIDWGDGTVSADVSGDQTHTYDTAGDYTIQIYGDFTRITLDENPSVAQKLLSIDQWGDIQWITMNSAFVGASSMTYNAIDAPDLSAVTDMSSMFEGASSFNGDLSDWDVSNVVNMTSTFSQASYFNGDLSDWDVSNVVNMTSTFSQASYFNGDLSDWDVSQVTDMTSTFSQASYFNGDLSDWDVSQVTDMTSTFSQASYFNGDLSDWDVSQVTDMESMFENTPFFNGDLSDWDVSQVTRMTSMFEDAPFFNGDVSDWDVSNVTNMRDMFSGASSFAGDVSDWDVSQVTSMNSMFEDAPSFDGDVSDWDVSNVTNMRGMFAGASSFNGDVSDWDISNVANMEFMFAGASMFDQNLGSWYITLDNTTIDDGGATGVVGGITAQNSHLDMQALTYDIGSGGDSDSFVIDRSILKLQSIPGHATKPTYTVNITSTGVFGTGNFRVFEITATGVPNNPSPVLADTLLPDAPQNLRASLTSNSVTLIWNPSNDDSITGYKIFSRTPVAISIISVPVADMDSTGSSYAVEGLEPDTSYVFWIVAINEHGQSDHSNLVSSTTKPPADTAATTLTPVERSDAQDHTVNSQTCRNVQHIQAQTPNGYTACVYESTAVNLGWIIINPE